ncbi:MAG TPA: hypothetical protein VKZ85_05165 [Woeseiaceae bacterium]|nr:hypothetical protein [Woeseiaceae bacterium]
MRQCRRAMLLFVVLVLGRAASGQDFLDLHEAEARDEAYRILAAAEERFSCAFEEVSMRDIGNEPGTRYLVHVRADGDECREALVFVIQRAERGNRLIFRQAADPIGRIDDVPMFPGEQVLIHEVNPNLEDEEAPEGADERNELPPDPA